MISFGGLLEECLPCFPTDTLCSNFQLDKTCLARSFNFSPAFSLPSPCFSSCFWRLTGETICLSPSSPKLRFLCVQKLKVSKENPFHLFTTLAAPLLHRCLWIVPRTIRKLCRCTLSTASATLWDNSTFLADFCSIWTWRHLLLLESRAFLLFKTQLLLHSLYPSFHPSNSKGDNRCMNKYLDSWALNCRSPSGAKGWGFLIFLDFELTAISSSSPPVLLGIYW